LWKEAATRPARSEAVWFAPGGKGEAGELGPRWLEGIPVACLAQCLALRQEAEVVIKMLGEVDKAAQPDGGMEASSRSGTNRAERGLRTGSELGNNYFEWVCRLSSRKAIWT
jgi:hypothetical protein